MVAQPLELVIEKKYHEGKNFVDTIDLSHNFPIWYDIMKNQHVI